MRLKDFLESHYGSDYDMWPYGRSMKLGDSVRIKGDPSGKIYKIVAVDSSEVGLDNGEVVKVRDLEPMKRLYRDASK